MDYKDGMMHVLTDPLWEKIGKRAHHGINLPLFSIHGKNSCGIGEFLDLIPLIDWCAEIGFDVIQLLPLNDANTNPSPYSAMSAFALHPIFLSLHGLPHVDKHADLKKMIEEMQDLSNLPRVALLKVLNYKLFFLHKYVDRIKKELIHDPLFKDFCAQNHWLESYALFRALKDKFQNTSMLNWPLEAMAPTRALMQEHEEAMLFYTILQFYCFTQLKEVKRYAESKRVLIKGDIPILLSGDSADVWEHPELFEMKFTAGAPPDAYSAAGQNWEFPIYRWESHKKNHYEWWLNRLKYASHFFDIYRIDHVLGLFRIWAIPIGKEAKDGLFIPEDEALWVPQGKELLSMMVQNAPMLPIGEDLGTVSPGVRETLAELGICGTKVVRWERDWMGSRAFHAYSSYFPLSLTTVSTHDVEPLSLWWKNFPAEAHDFARFHHWHYEHMITPSQIKQALTESHHTPSYFHINLLQEYLALFPELVAPHLEDERINIPGTTISSNWTYRFRPSIEELVRHEALKHSLKEIIKR